MVAYYSSYFWKPDAMRAAGGAALCALTMLILTHSIFSKRLTVLHARVERYHIYVSPAPQRISRVPFSMLASADQLEKLEVLVGAAACIVFLLIAMSHGYRSWRFERWMANNPWRATISRRVAALTPERDAPLPEPPLSRPVVGTSALGNRQYDIRLDWPLISTVEILAAAAADFPQFRSKIGVALRTELGFAYGFVCGGRLVIWWAGFKSIPVGHHPHVECLRLVALRDWRIAPFIFPLVLASADAYGAYAAIGIAIIGLIVILWRAMMTQPPVSTLLDRVIKFGLARNVTDNV